MPELPEVEVTLRRIAGDITGSTITGIIMRVSKLRMPLDPALHHILTGKKIRGIERRGKYLLISINDGWLMIHLGMTGHLRIESCTTPPDRHDHFELCLDNTTFLRLRDPRKFGTVLWCEHDPSQHPLIAAIGPEPLGTVFTGEYLFSNSRHRMVAIKQLIMNAKIVAGVGNIYANEALFNAGIRPDRNAGSLSETESTRLVAAIKEVLQNSIDRGSSCAAAEPESDSYHPIELAVYRRDGKQCLQCGTLLQGVRIGSRSTVFCPACQK